MTCRWATKTHHEREEEEAERLVRPSPKIKPPRRDLRRETVDVEETSDKEDDSDTSLNYKTIGGSLVERVVQRFGTEWVRVKNRDKDRVTRVTPETLKENPELYEKVPENEPYEQQGVRPSRHPREPEKPYYPKNPIPHPKWPDRPDSVPSPVPPPKAVSPVDPVPVPEPPTPEKPPRIRPPGWVKKRREAVVARYLDARKKPLPEASQGAPQPSGEGAPPKARTPKKKIVVRKKDTGWVGEVSEETLRKNPEAYEKVDEQEKEPEPASDSEKPQSVEPSTEEKAPETKPVPSDQVPSVPKPKPKPKKEKPQGEQVPEDQKDRPQGDQDKAPGKGGGPKPKKVDPWDQFFVLFDLTPVLGSEVAQQAIKAGVTKDTAGEFVRSYVTAKGSSIPGDVGKHLASLKKYYGEDNEILPPKMGRGSDGKLVPWEDLESSDQEIALESHRAKVLGLKMALDSQLQNAMKTRGLPESYGSALNKFVSNGRADADRASYEAFTERLSSGKVETTNPKKVADFIESLADPGDRKVVVAQYQADLLREVEKEVAQEHFSEWGTSQEILSSLQKAKEFVREREQHIPDKERLLDVYAMVQDRTMRKLLTLDERKAKAVQAVLDREAVSDYEKRLKDWEKREKALSKEIEKRRKEQKKIRSRVQTEVIRSLGPKFTMEAVDAAVDKELKAKGLHPDDDPKYTETKPQPPAAYYSRSPRRMRQEAKKIEQELLESMGEVSPRVKRAVRVASRWVAYSTCQIGCAMDHIPRTAVYWGVEPAPTDDYPDWDPKPKDLSQRMAQEFSYIPDASRPRSTGEANMSFTKQQADVTLSRLDKLAHAVQTSHEKWGMPFEVAKSIVNALDKTADEIETAAFGENSLRTRQIEVLKTAKVIQQDADEKYMGTFASPTAPHQVDADEPYMKLYSDDQSSAVNDGKSSTGRPLAP